MHVYVHVPFCARRCSYCDFSIAVRRDVPATEFAAAIASEIATRNLPRATLDTLYFGGGTPSKLGAEGVTRLVGVIRERFEIAHDAEVTLEANPEDVSLGAARAWVAAGVNRVSLGAQSFDDRVLSWMHRTHAADAIGRALHDLREAGIGNVSLDLIFALPEMLERDWSRDLSAAIALEPDHVSVYGLTVEHATPLGRWAARGDVHEAPEHCWAAEYEHAHATLAASGYAHYEVSNYARDGRRARHNESYWRDRPFVGLGPAAHGYDGASRRWNERAYAMWMARVHAGEDPVEGSELLTLEQQLSESVYLGLRTDRGLLLDPRDVPHVAPWIESGWAQIVERHDSRTIQLTASGWMRLDSLASALTLLRSHY